MIYTMKIEDDYKQYEDRVEEDEWISTILGAPDDVLDDLREVYMDEYV